MSEIKREPITIKVGNRSYVAFDEEHTISDILRYAATCADWHEVRLLAEMKSKEDNEGTE